MEINSAGSGSSPLQVGSKIGTAIAKKGQEVDKMVANELATLLSSATSAADGKGGSVDIKV